MSKKEKLKAQSLKQLEQKKEKERLELEEKQKAGESRSAAKMKKQAKKLNSAIMLFLKILMLVPYGYSGFFYGGIFVVGICTGEMEGMPKRIAAFLGIGSLVCVVGLFFAFFSKYVVQFVLIAAGSAGYLYGAHYIVAETTRKLAENYVEDEDLLVLDKTYMLYFYPLLAMTLISFILLVIFIVRKIRRKRRLKRERDNAPVKSIVE